MFSSPTPQFGVALRVLPSSPPDKSPSTPPQHNENSSTSHSSSAIERIPHHSPPGCIIFPSTPADPSSTPPPTGPPQRKRKRRSPTKPDAKMPELTQLLSKLTKDLQDHPIKDMAGWVHRPAAVRLSESSKRNGYVTRPMNSFFLYRLAYADRTKAWCARNDHPVISAVSGHSWPLEPKHIREKYTALATIERKNHRETYPDYKFSPSPKDTPMLKVVQGAVSDADVAAEGGVACAGGDMVSGDHDDSRGIVDNVNACVGDGCGADYVKDSRDGRNGGDVISSDSGERQADDGGDGDDEDFRCFNYEFDLTNYFLTDGAHDAYGIYDGYDYDSDVSPLGGSQWGSPMHCRKIAKTSHSSYTLDDTCYGTEPSMISPTRVYRSSSQLDSYRFEYQEADFLPVEFVHASEVEIEQIYTAAREEHTGTIVLRYNREDVWEQY